MITQVVAVALKKGIGKPKKNKSEKPMKTFIKETKTSVYKSSVTIIGGFRGDRFSFIPTVIMKRA